MENAPPKLSTEDPHTLPLKGIPPSLMLINYDPKSPTGKKEPPSNWFKRNIFTPEGIVVGCFSGAICKNLQELFEAIGRIPQKYLDRIPGGLMFPCAALKGIQVDENHENKNHGSQGLEDFDKFSQENGCGIALSYRGHTLAVKDSRAKNIHFYAKNGWIRLDHNDTLPDAPWIVKTYD